MSNWICKDCNKIIISRYSFDNYNTVFCKRCSDNLTIARDSLLDEILDNNKTYELMEKFILLNNHNID